MSKSKRAKENRAIELSRRLELEAENKKRIRRQNITGVLAVLCSLIIIAVVYFSISFYNNGTIMRKRVAFKSENYSVNNCMLSYFIYENYRDFINLNYEELNTKYELDSTKSLKKQDSTIYDGSWYDYFASEAQKDIEELLLYAEAAIDEDIKLEESDEKAIDKKIADLKMQAENQNYTNNDYYKFLYGRGVTEKDLRACFKLEALAKKYNENEVEAKFTYTDDQVEAVYAANPKPYSTIDYLYLTISADYDSDADKAEIEAAKNKADDWASKFKGASGLEAFKTLAKQYSTAKYDISDISDKLLSQLNIKMYEAATNVPYSDTDFGNAAFDSSVKEGQIIVILNSDGQYTVYCITKPMYRSTYLTKNIGLIDFNSTAFNSAENAKNYAEKSLATYKESPTDETFADLADSYSIDYTLAKAGGIINNVKHSQLDSLVEEWVFGSNRKAGDVTVIDSTNGSYLVRYVGDGYIAWQSDIIEALKSEFKKSHLEGLKQQHKITVNKNQLKKISL